MSFLHVEERLSSTLQVIEVLQGSLYALRAKEADLRTEYDALESPSQCYSSNTCTSSSSRCTSGSGMQNPHMSNAINSISQTIDEVHVMLKACMTALVYTHQVDMHHTVYQP